MGVPIVWKSKLQGLVSLSNTEAEYYALSESAKEIKFILQILKSIGIKILVPKNIYVDNLGAIFMAENNSATSRTLHIDARYHFIREYIIDGWIDVKCIKLEENLADSFTQDVNYGLYKKSTNTYLSKKFEN